LEILGPLESTVDFHAVSYAKDDQIEAVGVDGVPSINSQVLLKISFAINLPDLISSFSPPFFFSFSLFFFFFLKPHITLSHSPTAKSHFSNLIPKESWKPLTDPIPLSGVFKSFWKVVINSSTFHQNTNPTNP